MITDEQSKAAQEVAKTTGKFAEIAEKVGGFVSRVIGPASNQVGTVLEDWTRYYRFKNLLSIADKVESIHARRKVQGKTMPIPPRIAIPMLECAALEDDETLQDVWAKLIANSTDPNFESAIHPGYVEIAKQMSPDEAIILESFLNLESFPILFSNHVSKVVEETNSALSRQLWSVQRDEESYEKIYAAYQEHCKSLALKKPNDSRIYADNLVRLRIVELGQDFSSKNNSADSFFRTVGRRSSSPAEKPSVVIPARNEFMRMTAFGYGFVRACIGTCKKEPEQNTPPKDGNITVQMAGFTAKI